MNTRIHPTVPINIYRCILIQYAYWLIYLRNRGLIEVLWRQRRRCPPPSHGHGDRDWATGRPGSSPGQPQGLRTRPGSGDRERSPPIPYVLSQAGYRTSTGTSELARAESRSQAAASTVSLATPPGRRVGLESRL